MALARPQVSRRRRSALTRLLVALTAVCSMALAACSDGHIDVRSVPSVGWPSYGGVPGNANFAYADVPEDLTLSWTRPTGGPVTAPVTISGKGNVGVTSNAAQGCNVLVLDSRSGRKNFCKDMRAGVEINAMLVDQYDQPYLGEETTFLAFNAGGAIRWRAGVIGVPLSAKFAAPNEVLVATTQGQILLIDTQRNELLAPEVRLRDDADPAQPLRGFGDCVSNGPQCAIPAPAAVDTERERFFLNFFPQGAATSQIRAMKYGAVAGNREVRTAWQADVPSGVIGTPTLSADGATVYAFSRDGKIVALNAEDGSTRWTYDIGGHGFATMTVSPDGLIIPTGSLGAPLTLLRDRGDGAEQVWQRTDLATVSLSALTQQQTAWTVARDPGKDSLSLVEVSTTDGATKRILPLPNSRGFATGVSVSYSGQIATATNLGEVYFFDSKADLE
ncbi:PQQ-binding-like beta-propeller repeat protein [Gordonia hongkongensis]|uniref:PQQ-binding-like beta-propeller repeat protein n=1 Tax=Gordonia hongkongensis TaxID=1701090 RepID=A0AAX3T3X3_9ACTN|nr:MULTISPECIES: PQQ-binding-like beta-propeller repeat protein [Gordonia]QIK47313.1 PQQ-like beta-propeller repeat protein [Gordonia terrae]MBN0971968.1 PQQ-like beta-propeller repeat protein [Gordonia sp. BP-119]MBN0982823.1 PQQ-like beta-propeller repeat protein [Gordonia sp. BP-94]WFP23652.1 PQQ-binding-like beta-propeller repeat protein [Gordonia hongkongensis]WGJ84354.1 PQQ-binding-like beta-propeller repeat protein [Gordonia sp. SMJS1]